jgi:predicted amidohydrolase YtcJ
MAEDAPPIRRLIEGGVPLAAGTDMSRVSSYNPWYCMEWLVTGRGMGGARLLGGRNLLSREEALRLWTDTAWFSREEDRKGRLAPGMLADVAVLSDDFLAVPDDAIRHLTSVLTLAGGKVAWGAGSFAALMPELPPLRPDWSPVNRWGGTWTPPA